MKLLPLSTLPIAIILIGCETINTPITSTSFDPLTPPGMLRKAASSDSNSFASEFLPGEFASATIPNTAFYKVKPKDDQDADKLLDEGTQMKVISTDDSMVKVELDSGEIGYVPAVMLGPVGSDEAISLEPIDGVYPVFTPLPDGGPVQPLPVLDPSGVPPDGAIPAIIDPDAPFDDTSGPSLDTIPEPMPLDPTTGEDEINESLEADEEELDPVAEAVRLKVEAAMKEEQAKKAAENDLKPTPEDD